MYIIIIIRHHHQPYHHQQYYCNIVINVIFNIIIFNIIIFNIIIIIFNIVIFKIIIFNIIFIIINILTSTINIITSTSSSLTSSSTLTWPFLDSVWPLYVGSAGFVPVEEDDPFQPVLVPASLPPPSSSSFQVEDPAALPDPGGEEALEGVPVRVLYPAPAALPVVPVGENAQKWDAWYFKYLAFSKCAKGLRNAQRINKEKIRKNDKPDFYLIFIFCLLKMRKGLAQCAKSR